VIPIFNDLSQELKSETDRLQQALSTDLPAFNRVAQKLRIAPVSEK
jgi:hypothetical protein